MTNEEYMQTQMQLGTMDEVAGGDNGAWRHASIVRLRRETQGRRIEAIVDNERMAQELEVMGYERLELLRIPGSKQIDIAMGVLKGLNPEIICRAALLAMAEEGE